MKKAKKKALENLLESLEQAHIKIKEALIKKENTAAMQLLAQCQENAIESGELIETEEGETHPIISILEDYCETAYQIYEKIRSNTPLNSDTEFMRLCKLLSNIKECAQNDIPVRKEAVFLPYKASMWDSLESVWNAADEDPDWDAYVISIPYFDKNPDGSFGEMHDEYDLYPDYVPITKYNTFDFALHQPEIAFIHNPYDDYNYVTTVHPFYYTKNLKQYVEKLVYIPYYVLSEPDIESPTLEDDFGHFFCVPGVYNADQVIVQSENMRNAYIKVLTKKIGPKTKPYWENKILGLGSPKFDAFSNSKREALSIPAQWKTVLYKPDGTRKKVILYNTCVNSLVENGAQTLKKIENTLQVFKSMQENIALLWRPHPLTKTTLESMLPQLCPKYQEIVEQYASAGWGIYDDSADLHRAIALCDAYYGDGSSLVQLCQKAGKPVMIQNIEILSETSLE